MSEGDLALVKFGDIEPPKLLALLLTRLVSAHCSSHLQSRPAFMIALAACAGMFAVLGFFSSGTVVHQFIAAVHVPTIQVYLLAGTGAALAGYCLASAISPNILATARIALVEQGRAAVASAAELSGAEATPARVGTAQHWMTEIQQRWAFKYSHPAF